MSYSKKNNLSRRDFLKTAAVSAAAPMIVPSSVFGQSSPGNTLTMGCIGMGRQGQGDMQELIYRGLDVGARVVAVCDIDRHRRFIHPDPYRQYKPDRHHLGPRPGRGFEIALFAGSVLNIILLSRRHLCSLPLTSPMRLNRLY